MTKDGKIYHAKYAKHGEYIGRYVGNDRIDAVYHFEGGMGYSDADDFFDLVPGNEWVEEFYRG
jgi:hypothetical protein